MYNSHPGLHMELNKTWNHGKKVALVTEPWKWMENRAPRPIVFYWKQMLWHNKVLWEPAISRSVPSQRFCVEFDSWDNYAEVWRILMILKAKQIFIVQLTPALVSDGSLRFLNRCGCIFHSLWCEGLHLLWFYSTKNCTSPAQFSQPSSLYKVIVV